MRWMKSRTSIARCQRPSSKPRQHRPPCSAGVRFTPSMSFPPLGIASLLAGCAPSRADRHQGRLDPDQSGLAQQPYQENPPSLLVTTRNATGNQRGRYAAEALDPTSAVLPARFAMHRALRSVRLGRRINDASRRRPLGRRRIIAPVQQHGHGPAAFRRTVAARTWSASGDRPRLWQRRLTRGKCD